MNTTSVSVNKSIPDNSKIDVKAKSSKGEDIFKDMIRNASTKKTSDYKGKVVEEKAVEKPKTPDQPQSDENQDGSKGMSDVSLFLLPQAGIVDSMQLVKMVQIPSENLGLAESNLANSQIDGDQVVAKSPVAVVLQHELKTVGMPAKNAIGATPLTNVAQPLQEVPQQEKLNALSQQTADLNTVLNAPQETIDPKQVIQPKEMGEENTLPKGEEEDAVSGAEMKPNHGKDVQEAKVMIKVGDTSLKASWEQVAKEIGDMVVEKVNNEIQKISVKLNPKDLGEINVEFSMDNGKISVSLNCSNEGTKSLLSANLDTLSRVVQSSLMQETNVSIHYEKTDGQNPDNESFDGRGQGQYQGEENGKRKEQEQADLDFAQKLRLGIETLDDMEG